MTYHQLGICQFEVPNGLWLRVRVAASPTCLDHWLRYHDLFLQPERLHEHHIHINALVTLIRTDTTSYLYWSIRMLPRGVIYLQLSLISLKSSSSSTHTGLPWKEGYQASWRSFVSSEIFLPWQEYPRPQSREVVYN